MAAPSSTIKHIFSAKILGRKAARVIAIQCLYSIEQDKVYDKTTDEKLLDVLSIYSEEVKNSRFFSADQSLIIKLVRFTVDNRSQIESLIIPHLTENWQISRLPKLVACILYCAVSELFLDKTINERIIINDYLEAAKVFSHEGEVGFINTILDKISKNRDIQFTFS